MVASLKYDISPARKRWFRYALEYLLHVRHSHSLSTGKASSLNLAPFIFILQKEVKRVPFLALRVGITQSNMSMPRSMFSIKSSGVPTPIK